MSTPTWPASRRWRSARCSPTSSSGSPAAGATAPTPSSSSTGRPHEPPDVAVTPLPESVRRRVVDLAADQLGLLPAEDVPVSLRAFVKFAPGRRRQVVLPIAAALEN